MDAVKFSNWHKGFLAFRAGQALKRRGNIGIKIYKTEAEAWAALKKSKKVGF